MIMRPLFFDFSEDEKASGIPDQYMLGDSLMICPVTGEEDRRDVYLPEGTGWYDMLTEKYYEGGRSVEMCCNLAHIPVFVKAGSLIPGKEAADCTDRQKGAATEVVVYPGKDAAFRLYEDAGDGYGYEQGEYCITELKWEEAKQAFSAKTTGDMRFRSGEIRFRIASGERA
jgi:alpha-D-xyloside xylohydrolase